MQKFNLILGCLFLLLSTFAFPSENSFEELLSDFENEYSKLNIPDLRISYVDNLKAISSKDNLKKQEQFFKRYKKRIQQFNVENLSQENGLNYKVLEYEINLNLDRISLENKWLNGNYTIKETKLYDETLGKEWYAYFLKKWIDIEATPDAVFQFGLSEIELVKSRLNKLQTQLNLDDEAFKKEWGNEKYYLSDKGKVLDNYNALKGIVNENAKQYFSNVDRVPKVDIALSTNKAMASAPAYYNNNTFYYNFFGDVYDKRDMGWILMHEAIPGHHYEGFISAENTSSIRRLFHYSSFVEGWGAYIEQFGKELGAYKTPFDEIAQLNWDLVRSVRVALDVGLNYYGWSDDKALAFWQQNLRNKDDIAWREIKRMKRWPVQVITYKYGKQILDELKGNRNSPIELKAFHTEVLKYGQLPISVLKQHLKREENIAQDKGSISDSVFICDVKFNDLAYNNPHAGSGFILNYKGKLYGITAKHVLFFAKTDSMKTISFGDQLHSWNFASKEHSNTSIQAGKLINENPKEAITMPPKGDWLVFEINDPIPKNVAVYHLREQPLTMGESVRFMGYPYNRKKAVNVQGSFIGYTNENNLKLDVPKGNYGGCSGGPVVDMDGNLVGIVSMGYYNEKEQKMIFEPASLDYFKEIMQSINDNKK